jgi:hypothetical protein
LQQLGLLPDKLFQGGDGGRRIVLADINFSEQEDGIGVFRIESQRLLNTADRPGWIVVEEMGNSQMLMGGGNPGVGSSEAFELSESTGGITFCDANTRR